MEDLAGHRQPEVSVVMAVKNEAQYVRQAVESVISQCDVSPELIIIDDGSTDETFEISSEIAAGNPAVRVFKNPGKGKVSAFNYGVEMATGAWVCLFAGDDIMPPGALAGRVAAVENIESNGPILGLCRLVTMSEDPKTNGVYVPKSPSKGAYSGACYLFSAQALELMWPIPMDLPNEDTWLEVAAMHLDLHIVHSGVVGLKWRLHSGNSINYMLPFHEFNRRLTPRMSAAERFLDLRGSFLSREKRSALEARVACEDARRRGNILGILTSGVGMRDKLRALSQANALLYGLRARFYGLLSGW